jgi:hypothetical protein
VKTDQKIVQANVSPEIAMAMIDRSVAMIEAYESCDRGCDIEGCKRRCS